MYTASIMQFGYCCITALKLCCPYKVVMPLSSRILLSGVLLPEAVFALRSYFCFATIKAVFLLSGCLGYYSASIVNSIALIKQDHLDQAVASVKLRGPLLYYYKASLLV